VPTCTRTGTTSNDKPVGTTGRDILCSGPRNDTLIGKGGNVILLGESGNDSLQGGTENDILNGGTGTDTASYASSMTAVSASLATAFATGEGSDLLSYVERLTGSSRADTLTVADSDGPLNAATILKGPGGADTLDAQGGHWQRQGGRRDRERRLPEGYWGKGRELPIRTGGFSPPD
jgi:Ca2+-binding RTX toxin-like protein